MCNGLGVHQRAAFAKVLDDPRVRLEYVKAGPQRYIRREFAAMIDGRVRLEPVTLTGLEIVGSVTGRGVNKPCACVERDVVAQNEDPLARQERVLVAEALERRALESFD